jgi:hypothetical protein
VELKVGLDGPNNHAVARFVKAHTIESVLNDPHMSMGKRLPTSVSAEGQSISWKPGSVAEGAAGSLPNIKTLNRWKRYGVHRSNRAPVSVWPLSGVGYSDAR